jgi:hypothetical protein
MMPENQQQDLVILVADRNMEAAISGIISRNNSLGIRRISYKVYPHVHRDPGCRLEGHLFLRPYAQSYSYAIVMFDREGCGQDHLSRDELEAGVEQNLFNTGWQGRAAALVLDPELEIWVWKDSPHVEAAFGWTGRQPNLRTWLSQKGYLRAGEQTPSRPKEAMEEALRIVRKPRSSAIYSQLAQTVGFRDCNNPTFMKLRNTLQQWFRSGINEPLDSLV